jgi:hypothetical protein
LYRDFIPDPPARTDGGRKISKRIYSKSGRRKQKKWSKKCGQEQVEVSQKHQEQECDYHYEHEPATHEKGKAFLCKHTLEALKKDVVRWDNLTGTREGVNQQHLRSHIIVLSILFPTLYFGWQCTPPHTHPSELD